MFRVLGCICVCHGRDVVPVNSSADKTWRTRPQDKRTISFHCHSYRHHRGISVVLLVFSAMRLALTATIEALELPLSAILFSWGRLAFCCAKFPQGRTFPEPTPYALHTCIPFSKYAMLLIKLTPSHFTEVPFAGGCGPLTVTLTLSIPPEDSMAAIICVAVSMLWPELRYTLMWLLIVAALRSQAPFPPWGSEKSTRSSNLVDRQ